MLCTPRHVFCWQLEITGYIHPSYRVIPGGNTIPSGCSLITHKFILLHGYLQMQPQRVLLQMV